MAGLAYPRQGHSPAPRAGFAKKSLWLFVGYRLLVRGFSRTGGSVPNGRTATQWGGSSLFSVGTFLLAQERAGRDPQMAQIFADVFTGSTPRFVLRNLRLVIRSRRSCQSCRSRRSRRSRRSFA